SSTHPIWSSAQSIGSTINDGTVTWTAEGQPSVIDVEEPGEGAIVHDLNVRGNSSSQSVVMDDIRVGDSVAGFAGFFNIETVDARYGLNIAAVTSRVPVYSISGDQNNSIVNIIESGNGIIGINGLKAESFASGINEPAINIQGGVGKQLTLNVRNMYVAGNPGAGGCVQFQKASSGAPVSQNCDVIKISGGGASIGLDNVDASLFSNLINDTAAAKKIALVEFGPVIQHFTYSSFANFGMYTSGDGNYSDGLDVFGAGISTNGVFGTLAVSALASPGAPTLSAGGAAGSTTYNYACTAKDAAGKSTAVPAFTALTTGNATLSQTNYNIINCPLPAGATQICVYKTNNTTLLGCGDAVESYSGSGVAELYDHGQGTTAVGAMTINQTGGLSAVTLTGAGTPAISGGGALSTGSNSLVGNITGTGASNTLTLPSSAACPNAVVLTLTDNTTTGGAKQTAQTATSATFSTTAADNVNYSIGCR
ncbi:MAG: hypothetical protein ACREQT_01715, partial [Candidatus Binataceae bacterium]